MIKTEIKGLEGGVQTTDSVSVNGEPLGCNVNIIKYPAGEMDYNNNFRREKVIYQVYELNDEKDSFSAKFVIVAGYKRSKQYLKEGRKTAKVEIIGKKERSQLEEVIKLMIDDECTIAFLENGKGELKNEFK